MSYSLDLYFSAPKFLYLKNGYGDLLEICPLTGQSRGVGGRDEASAGSGEPVNGW